MSQEPIPDDALQHVSVMSGDARWPTPTAYGAVSMRDLARALIEARGAIRAIGEPIDCHERACCAVCGGLELSGPRDGEVEHADDCAIVRARALLPKPAGDAEGR